MSFCGSKIIALPTGCVYKWWHNIIKAGVIVLARLRDVNDEAITPRFPQGM